MAQRCADLHLKSCALSDHGSISGVITFVEAMQKKDILPILGLEAYISTDSATIQSPENKKLLHQVILAKNLTGYRKLIQLVSKSNDPNLYYYRPRVDLEILSEICNDDLVSFSGHPGSILYNHVLKGEEKEIDRYIHRMWDIFGKENFFIEIQFMDERPEVKGIMNELRNLAELYHIKPIATCDAHYATPDQSEDHKVLLCSSLQTTLKEVKRKIELEEKIGMDGFFKSNRFHIPTVSELLEYGNTLQEIDNTQIITEMCELYSIFNPPMLPKYKWTDSMDETEYFKHLCRKGWVDRKIKEQGRSDEYKERILNELTVIHEANLEGYFLIVQDYVNYAKNQGWLVGSGRGSCGGCLIAYLLNITCVDPIKYGLIFERFYNAGRNTTDRVSLPDIDVDFPISKREQVIEYIKERYGSDKVAQMVTFSRLMGRGALKEVLRVHSTCDFGTMNNITKTLPQEHEIADQLEDMGETSIINWVLKNDPKLVSDYCTLQEDKYEGEYAIYFKQAARLEGTYKSSGKHAAGVVVSPTPLDQICPMIRSKSKNDDKIIGFDMNDSEKIGLVKLDVLGTAILDKLMGVNSLLKCGKVEV